MNVRLALCTLALTAPLALNAQVASNPATGELAPIVERGASCSIVNIQGALAAGFLSYNAPGGGHAVYIDPSATGGAGDPGCGAGDFTDDNFLIDTVTLDLADASAFNAGTGVGTADWSLTIHSLATPGDPCGGPGAVIWNSGTQTLNADASGQYFPALSVGQEVSEPFFVQWNLLGLSNAGEPISPLWDAVSRPLCRQFVTQDSGAVYTDHTDFFTMGGTGWLDVVVDGDFVPRGTLLEVPTVGTWGLISLFGLLGIAGVIYLRRL